MALRSPLYLDVETLLSQAEYFGVEVPHQAEIVERTTRKRSGGGKVGMAGVEIDGSRGTDIEFQSSYTLKPRQKATVSRVIDSLMEMGAITSNPDGTTTLSKDDLVEVEGTTGITSASLAGKLFYMFRRFLAEGEGDLDKMLNLQANDPQVVKQIKRVYLQNELLPLPILLHLTGSGLPQKVYVNVRPAHFIDAASANRVEGEMRVLGTVSRLIPGGEEGYLSTEEWLLYDWEYLVRRMAMTRMDELRGLFDGLDLGLPTKDVHHHIAGPAILIDATALY